MKNLYIKNNNISFYHDHDDISVCTLLLYKKEKNES